MENFKKYSIYQNTDICYTNNTGNVATQMCFNYCKNLTHSCFGLCLSITREFSNGLKILSCSSFKEKEEKA